MLKHLTVFSFFYFVLHNKYYYNTFVTRENNIYLALHHGHSYAIGNDLLPTRF